MFEVYRKQVSDDLLDEEALQIVFDHIDDVACMAVAATMKAHGICDTIPAEPEADSEGLLMQMVVPRVIKI